MIWKDVMDYIIAYMKECLVVFCLHLLTQRESARVRPKSGLVL